MIFFPTMLTILLNMKPYVRPNNDGKQPPQAQYAKPPVPRP